MFGSRSTTGTAVRSGSATTAPGRRTYPTTTQTSASPATTTRRTTTLTRRTKAPTWMASRAVSANASAVATRTARCRRCSPESAETSRFSASMHASVSPSSTLSCATACRRRTFSTRSGLSVTCGVSRRSSSVRTHHFSCVTSANLVTKTLKPLLMVCRGRVSQGSTCSPGSVLCP